MHGQAARGTAGFSLVTLRRDLADLDDRLAEDMNMEKFVEINSAAPIFHASSYYLASDGDAGRAQHAGSDASRRILHPSLCLG
jgi:hypothetical protein